MANTQNQTSRTRTGFLGKLQNFLLICVLSFGAATFWDAAMLPRTLS